MSHINPQSDKRRYEEDPAYKKAAREYLMDLAIRQHTNHPLGHPLCEGKILCRGRGAAREIHHRARRHGRLLCYKPLFMGCCRRCHRYIEDNYQWSIDKGFMIELTKEEYNKIQAGE